VEAVFEGAGRAGGGVNEEMGEPRAVVGEVGEAGVERCGRVGRVGRRRGAQWPLAKI
jgi:hypothetical protein